MSFEPQVATDEIAIVLRGIDRLLCWRRAVRAELTAVTAARRFERQELEPRLDHRVYGRGSHHRGDRGRHRTRVGAFLGRDVHGQQQFWAVPRDARSVVALDLDHGPFRRIVLGEASCPAALLDLSS